MPRDRPQPRFRVVIDCDPGVDDALALLAALANPGWQLDFITTVAGNGPIKAMTANALGTVALTGRDDVPVLTGGAGPLARSLERSGTNNALPGIHEDVGPTQLAGQTVPELRRWLLAPSALPKRLVAIGPLTSIAELAMLEPEALRGLDALYIMGGSVGRRGGRFSPVAETNFFLDPEAADIVLRSGAPIRIFDYDATSSATVAAELREAVEASIPQPFRRPVSAWFDALHDAQVVHQRRPGWAVHDLCAVAGAAGIEPGRWETLRLNVELGAERGALVSSTTNLDDPAAIHVARGLDTRAILRFLTSNLNQLPAAQRSVQR